MMRICVVCMFFVMCVRLFEVWSCMHVIPGTAGHRINGASVWKCVFLNSIQCHHLSLNMYWHNGHGGDDYPVFRHSAAIRRRDKQKRLNSVQQYHHLQSSIIDATLSHPQVITNRHLWLVLLLSLLLSPLLRKSVKNCLQIWPTKHTWNASHSHTDTDRCRKRGFLSPDDDDDIATMMMSSSSQPSSSLSSLNGLRRWRRRRRRIRRVHFVSLTRPCNKPKIKVMIIYNVPYINVYIFFMDALFDALSSLRYFHSGFVRVFV